MHLRLEGNPANTDENTYSLPMDRVSSINPNWQLVVPGPKLHTPNLVEFTTALDFLHIYYFSVVTFPLFMSFLYIPR